MIERLAARLLAALPRRNTMSGALRNVARRHPVRTVIDVGASDGRWSALARRHYPHARFLLVEAQGAVHGAALERYVKAHPGAEVALAAAGPREGVIHFDGSDPFGGVASETSTGAADTVLPMTTVDAEVARRGLEPPYLLKLDTHGFEVPILAGAARTLQRASVLVIEAYNFTLCDGALRLPQLCAHLEGRGFRCLDVVDPLYRSDGALWQVDAVFLRADAPEFRTETWTPVRS